jgi:hydrogenase maturation factor
MSDEPRNQLNLLKHDSISIDDTYCKLDAEGHRRTCSDEALQVRVTHVDQENGLALVTIDDSSEEIDITLVESVEPGDILLVHGGVAITRVNEANNA